jgi:hypothetical protein
MLIILSLLSILFISIIFLTSKNGVLSFVFLISDDVIDSDDKVSIINLLDFLRRLYAEST